MNAQSFNARKTRAVSVYERVREAYCTPFTEHYEGSLDAFFCVISSHEPSEAVRTALQATAQRKGFSLEDMIWVDASLDSGSLFTLVECVDPFCVVILDRRAAEAVSRAYNQPVLLDVCDALLGKPSCCFVDFERMLQTSERKQQAWGLLKEMLLHLDL